MSKDTWLAEFYPVPCEKTSPDEAIDHSIQKWTGLSLKNLHKHGLSTPPIMITCDTCAMCFHYDCPDCPLAGHLKEFCDESRDGPWYKWQDCGDSVPMLAALKSLKKGSELS